MTLGSQEHINIMAQFERDIRHCSAYSLRFDREDKRLWPKGHFYQDGNTNHLFQAYKLGYSYARCVYLHAE